MHFGTLGRYWICSDIDVHAQFAVKNGSFLRMVPVISFEMLFFICWTLLLVSCKIHMLKNGWFTLMVIVFDIMNVGIFSV